jgi:hypothetical protein
MRLTAEQQARAFAAYGVCANQACDGCGKVLAEVRWTRRDLPETYCSRLCRDGIERRNGQCSGCGVDLAGKRRGARWCSDTCRMRNRVKDSTNNPKMRIHNIGLTEAEIDLGYHPTRTALFTDNPKRNHPQRQLARTGGRKLLTYEGPPIQETAGNREPNSVSKAAIPIRKTGTS